MSKLFKRRRKRTQNKNEDKSTAEQGTEKVTDTTREQEESIEGEKEKADT